MNFSTQALLIYSLLGAAIAIYLPYIVVAYARFQTDFDLNAPRANFEQLPDYGKRATWAHQNSFEVFMVFGVAALAAYVTGVDSPWAGKAAIAFVVSRVFYSVFYIGKVAPLRSLMFGVGTASTLTLFVLSILRVTG